MINGGQGPGDSVIYGGSGGGDQHIWMVGAPEGNLTLKPIQHSSPSLPNPPSYQVYFGKVTIKMMKLTAGVVFYLKTKTDEGLWAPGKCLSNKQVGALSKKRKTENPL